MSPGRWPGRRQVTRRSPVRAPPTPPWPSRHGPKGRRSSGLNVNYTSTGSPSGLSSYAVGTATFAGTEAEYTELYPTTSNANTKKVQRGFAYTPDVAGAVAVMYHVALNSTGSDPVTYLHLSPLTVARIFMGIITTWTSPTISKDNKGLVLPHKPITLDLRSGQSGTTALFYDWVEALRPIAVRDLGAANSFPTTTRVWEVDDGQDNGQWGGFGNGGGRYNDLGGSDQQAEAIASGHRAVVDRLRRVRLRLRLPRRRGLGGERLGSLDVQPYAKNIAAALKSAVLAPTTSQTLVGVYNSQTPTAYPMSAYSYILYQCATTPTRPTCKAAVLEPGRHQHDGQVHALRRLHRPGEDGHNRLLATALRTSASSWPTPSAT